MATKAERAQDENRKNAARKAAQALFDGNANAIGAVAGTHSAGETCAQTIARVSNLGK